VTRVKGFHVLCGFTISKFANSVCTIVAVFLSIVAEKIGQFLVICYIFTIPFSDFYAEYSVSWRFYAFLWEFLALYPVFCYIAFSNSFATNDDQFKRLIDKANAACPP
jgi:hypothetical protein